MYKIKRYKLAVAVLLLLISVFFCIRKADYHLNEYFSYGFANEKGYIDSCIDHSGDYPVLTREGMEDYLTAGGDDRSRFGQIADNMAADVHPPLYLWLLNAVCSLFFPGAFSKWAGLSLNLVFYALTLLTLYKLLRGLFQRESIALSVILLYGLSPIGLSTLLMIRMYGLLTLLSVLLGYWTFLDHRCAGWASRVRISLCVCLGLLTHYYYAIFVFFLTVGYGAFLLKAGQKRKLRQYLLSVAVGFLLMTAIFPRWPGSIFTAGKVSVYRSFAELLRVDKWLYRFGVFFRIRQLIASFAVISVWLALILFALKREAGDEKTEAETWLGLIMGLSGLLSFVLIVIIAPFGVDRYFYFIFPYLYLIGAFLLSRIPEGRSQRLFLPLSAALALLAICIVPPGYLFTGDSEREYRQFVQEHKDDKSMILGAVMFEEESFIVSDLSELMTFESVPVIERPDTPGYDALMARYEGEDSLLVFTGYDPDLEYVRDRGSQLYREEDVRIIARRLGLSRVELIHEGTYSKLYFLKR